jgi:hypothetical protein
MASPPPLPTAELSALSSTIDEVSRRIGEIAASRHTPDDRKKAGEDSDTVDLEVVETMLRNANRRLSRLTRRRTV